MSVVIIKYQSGNIFSVREACRSLGYEAMVSDEPEVIRSAEKVLFPGVGQASSAMESLRDTGLESLLPQLQQPVLGICLGMQLLFDKSAEEDTECLGILPGAVLRFPEDPACKVPHMGWNRIYGHHGPLFEGVDQDAYMYYVHSYYLPPNRYSLAETPYYVRFSAAVQKNNFFGCQFHPEKSGTEGRKVLRNFLSL
jgi:imidazole glycerol-phosphate synthase subunit HisH